jgi:hypothetical protein
MIVHVVPDFLHYFLAPPPSSGARICLDLFSFKEPRNGFPANTSKSFLFPKISKNSFFRENYI